MMRIGAVAVVVVLAGAVALPGRADAQSAPSGVRLAQAISPDAPPRKPRKPPTTRLRVEPNYEPDEVYPRYYPGPNAVRECNATYVQEYRPSGTVIVPHMSCHWRRG
jgi:hypothetical protein